MNSIIQSLHNYIAVLTRIKQLNKDIPAMYATFNIEEIEEQLKMANKALTEANSLWVEYYANMGRL